MNQAQIDRILIIGDDADLLADLRATLAAPADRATRETPAASHTGTFARAAGEGVFELHHARHGDEGVRQFLAARECQPFFAVVIDLHPSPGTEDLQTIERIHQIDADATIVICTSQPDRIASEIASRGVDLDRLQILSKPCDPTDLRTLAALLVEGRTHFRHARLRQDEFARERRYMDQLGEIIAHRTIEIRKSAHYDKLTELPNRVQFHDRLLSAIAQHQRDPRANYAVMFIDFDRFKVINHSLGRDFGNMLLKAISERLTRAIEPVNPPDDSPTRALAARLGGDEFCLLIEHFHDEADVMNTADRVLKLLAKPYELSGHQVNSTASIGITLSRFGYRHAEDVLRDADMAMHCAKSAGRDRAVVFDPAMHERAMQRLVLENDLRHAIERGELRLHFQPIVSLESALVHGAEGLLRWAHPTHGMLSPLDFIPLAEETGLIVPIGAWVFEQAARQLVQTPQLKYVSVNVARRQLVDPHFISTFDDVLGRTGVDPTRLTLEITESTLIDEPEKSSRAIDLLRSRKMRVFLDDFGTGLSSLGSLRRFPLDGVKLDRSFLDEQVFSRRGVAVIRSTITLARDLDMLMIAEGVESVEQVALLQALGCEAAQGYLFSRPVSPDKLQDAIQNREFRVAA